MTRAYYNEFKPEAAHMLRGLISDGLIAPGEVDERSIADVKPEDLKGFTQCHFFAGIGGWSLALRQAGWSDDRPVWTGSCPCQPYSTAGKQKGAKDERDLWPVWFTLIRECSPPIVFGEQVSSAISHGWLDRMRSDMETEGYAVGSAVLPACSVDAPHKRDRLWFVADPESPECERGGDSWDGRPRPSDDGHGHLADSNSHERGVGDEQPTRQLPQPDQDEGAGNMGDPEYYGWHGRTLAGSDEETVHDGTARADSARKSSGASEGGAVSGISVANSERIGQQGSGLMGQPVHTAARGEGQAGELIHDRTGFWSRHDWLLCGDGKVRRIPTVESGIRIVAHGVQHRVPLLHALGNAIVPEVAARFIKAVM